MNSGEMRRVKRWDNSHQNILRDWFYCGFGNAKE